MSHATTITWQAELKAELPKSITKVGCDTRNNTWFKAKIPSHYQFKHFICNALADWLTMSDDDLDSCKRDFQTILGESREVKGMACYDFLYLFTADSAKHYFIPVQQEASLYIYEGECDMHLNPDMTHSTLQEMIALGI